MTCRSCKEDGSSCSLEDHDYCCNKQSNCVADYKIKDVVCKDCLLTGGVCSNTTDYCCSTNDTCQEQTDGTFKCAKPGNVVCAAIGENCKNNDPNNKVQVVNCCNSSDPDVHLECIPRGICATGGNCVPQGSACKKIDGSYSPLQCCGAGLCIPINDKMTCRSCKEDGSSCLLGDHDYCCNNQSNCITDYETKDEVCRDCLLTGGVCSNTTDYCCSMKDKCQKQTDGKLKCAKKGNEVCAAMGENCKNNDPNNKVQVVNCCNSDPDVHLECIPRGICATVG